MTEFAQALLRWQEKSGRKDLPWQQDPTPYRVWISEIMLQQTQVATVIPYYVRFMATFPDVGVVADADIDDVLHHWSGLGYYARARNLHKAAVTIRDRFDGQFPAAFEDVITLPGIGRSTAGAILSLSRGQRHPILDGNVKRVLARYHAVPGWPGKSDVAEQLWQHAEAHTPSTIVAAYTQAMMDLGATVCTRTLPACPICPLVVECAAHTAGRETAFPGRREKKTKPQKQTKMLLVRAGDAVYLERRPPSGIWGGLWSFPELDPEEDAVSWLAQKLNAVPAEVQEWPMLRHSFTHYDLDILPAVIRLESAVHAVADSSDHLWHELDAAPHFGLAAPVAELLARLKAGIRVRG